MNGRMAKRLRKVFDDPLERRRFRRAYNGITGAGKDQVRRISTKIAESKKAGQTVRTFKINETTGQMEPTEEGETNGTNRSENHASSTSSREGNNKTKSKANAS